MTLYRSRAVLIESGSREMFCQYGCNANLRPVLQQYLLKARQSIGRPVDCSLEA